MNRTRLALLATGLLVTSCSVGGNASALTHQPVEASETAVAHTAPAPVIAEQPGRARTDVEAAAAPNISTTELRPTPLGARVAPADASPPTRVVVPAAGIDAPLDQLGIGGDGAVEAPANFDRAGWYAGSVMPGQPGPAVLAGHVDSKSGPAAFYGLATVTAGDEIVVHRADGSTIAFRVTSVQQYAKEQLAAEVVHGPVTSAELRLITCAGPFDRSSGHYRDNVVVFAVSS